MGVPQGLLGNGVHSRCSQTGNFTWEVGFKYLEALKNLRQLGFNPQVNRFHLRDGHITGRVVIPELFLGELRGSHLGGGWSLRAAGSLLVNAPESRKGQRGDILAFLLFLPSVLQQVPLPGQTLLAVSWQWEPGKCSLQRGGEVGCECVK